jgi:uncharacterized membrane protein YqjE
VITVGVGVAVGHLLITTVGPEVTRIVGRDRQNADGVVVVLVGEIRHADIGLQAEKKRLLQILLFVL